MMNNENDDAAFGDDDDTNNDNGDQKNEDGQFVSVDVSSTLLDERAPGHISIIVDGEAKQIDILSVGAGGRKAQFKIRNFEVNIAQIYYFKYVDKSGVSLKELS